MARVVDDRSRAGKLRSTVPLTIPQVNPPPETEGQRRMRLFGKLLNGVPGIAAIRLELAWRRLVAQRELRLIDRNEWGTRILAEGMDSTIGAYRVVLRPEDDGACSVGLEATPKSDAPLAFVLTPRASFVEQPSMPQGIVYVPRALADLDAGWTVHTNDVASLDSYLAAEARAHLRAHPHWTLHRDRGNRIGVGWAGRIATTAHREGGDLDDALSLLRLLCLR
ncbi:hypothetical protein [Sorangium sp. So ce388]|uniref:hypothetical protein n=1 Tax=Sorangium sp. So ce388 TaxID=3133309 RepID=UPI003F5B31D0